jgi:hypothetical protein
MTRLRLRKFLFSLPLLLSLAAQAQFVKVPTDGSEQVGTPVTANPSTRPPNNDSADRIKAQFDRFGGPLSQADKLVNSLQRQQQIYGAQVGGKILPAGMPVWRSSGPTSAKYETNYVTLKVSDSGRVRTILQSPADDDTVYVLTSGGGLWKTTTFTHTNPIWQPKTDSLLTTSGGSVALGRSPGIFYFGLDNPHGLLPRFGGFFTCSDDGEDTWTPVATVPGASTIRDIKVDTSRPADRLVVAGMSACLDPPIAARRFPK